MTPTSTRPRPQKGRTNMEIDELEAISDGEVTQWVRIRSRDANNPVLLLIQQGPVFR